MTKRDKMYAAFPYLQEQGFEGMYPHFRRNNGACIELVTFQTNKWGGSFRIEVSVVFPGRKNPILFIGTNLPENSTTAMCIKRQ